MSSSSLPVAVAAVILCLAAAGMLTLLSTPGPGTLPPGAYPGPGSGLSAPATIQPGVPAGETASSATHRIRVLWYDPTGRTYTFRDYDRPAGSDASTWSDAELPAPENGTRQRQAAMVRFIEWDGKVERMTGTRYLTDQDLITTILNSYTLIAPPRGGNQSGAAPEAEPVTTLTPEQTPAPGMLIPTVSTPCNQGDGTIRVSFGYTSRHSTPVSLPVGGKNHFSPGDPDQGQPTIFQPGIHRDIFTVTFPENGTNIVWNLMGTVVGAGTVPRLQAEIRVEPVAGYAPLTIRVEDASSGGTTTNPITGIWDFGDGATAAEISATHRFERPGTFTVSRTVSTHCGSEAATREIAVYAADFRADPVTGSPRTFRFTDLSTGSPEKRYWNFNDGFSSWETEPVHTFGTPGTYAVSLTVSGTAGSGTAVRTITAG